MRISPSWIWRVTGWRAVTLWPTCSWRGRSGGIWAPDPTSSYLALTRSRQASNSALSYSPATITMMSSDYETCQHCFCDSLLIIGLCASATSTPCRVQMRQTCTWLHGHLTCTQKSCLQHAMLTSGKAHVPCHIGRSCLIVLHCMNFASMMNSLCHLSSQTSKAVTAAKHGVCILPSNLYTLLWWARYRKSS